MTRHRCHRPAPSLRPVAHRLPARRRRAHRALQLALRAEVRRRSSCCASRTPTRRAAPTRARARSSTACSGSGSTGTRRSSTRAPTSSATSADADAHARRRRRLPLLLHARRSSTSGARAAEAARTAFKYDRRCDRLDARRSRASRRRRRAVRRSLPRARRHDGVGRPGARDDRVPEQGHRGLHRPARRTARRSTTWPSCRDDIAMGITLVMRGDDHISNTPKQILLYRALGAPLPHVRAPADDPRHRRQEAEQAARRHRGRRLPAPRHPARARCCNFLALLGWSPGRRHRGDDAATR